MVIVLAALSILVAAFCLYGRYQFRKMEKQYPPNGQFVTVEGITLHYVSRGEGRPVVFLHGGVLTGNDFRESIELAASAGYRGIAFDRPGYGHSERPIGEPVTPRTQARLLHEALGALGIEKPILVGHSWSGVLVLTYAIDYPDDISGIVTLGGGMYPEGYPAEKGDPISTLVTTPILGNIVMHSLLAVMGPALAVNVLKETFKPEPVPEAYREATLAYWLRPSQFRANREDVLAFVPGVRAIMDRYPEIDTPLVIAVGADDPFPTREHSFRLHEQVPDSKLLLLPGVAHMIPQNHPEAVMEAVKAIPNRQGKFE
ncbi:alpha/beta hydrolase [Brevibacillus brevis]|uniref:Alpha/beta hydrolase n=1 Tax=Brevibacillus brevis TaxID=1393 RepID=A0ABY9TB78_BREBE|nr:alpha/beta hydrolase [Brevibacillus brevis]WNC17362.1 alpha/beta hydrolase [Brevibacillus brevis]